MNLEVALQPLHWALQTTLSSRAGLSLLSVSAEPGQAAQHCAFDVMAILVGQHLPPSTQQ